MEKGGRNNGNILYLNRSSELAVNPDDEEFDDDLAKIIKLDTSFAISREGTAKSLYFPDSGHDTIVSSDALIGQVHIVSVIGMSSFSAAHEIYSSSKKNKYGLIILENSNMNFLPQVKIAKRLSKKQNAAIVDPFISPFSSNMVDFISKQFSFPSGFSERNAISLISSHLQSIGWSRDTIDVFLQSYFNGASINDIENIRSDIFFARAFISQLEKFSLYISMQIYSNLLLDSKDHKLENPIDGNMLVITSHKKTPIFLRFVKNPKIKDSMINAIKSADDRNSKKFAKLLSGVS